MAVDLIRVVRRITLALVVVTLTGAASVTGAHLWRLWRLERALVDAHRIARGHLPADGLSRRRPDDTFFARLHDSDAELADCAAGGECDVVAHAILAAADAEAPYSADEIWRRTDPAAASARAERLRGAAIALPAIRATAAHCHRAIRAVWHLAHGGPAGIVAGARAWRPLAEPCEKAFDALPPRRRDQLVSAVARLRDEWPDRALWFALDEVAFRLDALARLRPGADLDGLPDAAREVAVSIRAAYGGYRWRDRWAVLDGVDARAAHLDRLRAAPRESPPPDDAVGYRAVFTAEAELRAAITRFAEPVIPVRGD